MADPVTIGALTASALAMAGEAALKGAVSDQTKEFNREAMLGIDATFIMI
jgi:hypothetical protein